MKKIILIAISIMLGMALTACGFTETDRAQKSRAFTDTPATLICHDYGGVVFSGRSKGKPQRSDTGEGMWEFVNAQTGKFTQVEGNCVVAYD